MKPNFRKTLILVLTTLTLILSAVGVTPAYAATLTVTTAVDNLTNGNGCSLREAVANANSDTQTFPDCIGGSGADTITFDGGLSGATISLTSIIILLDDVTIDGSMLTQQVIISGGGSTGIFGTGNPAVDVTLDSLTIDEGVGQGAGFNNSGGTLVVRNSNFYRGNMSPTGRGGAIYNQFGTVEVTNSLFLNNYAVAGGAIYNWYGSLTVIDSTFESNGSTGYPGGGAIASTTGVLTVTNSTFSYNSAGGGVPFSSGGGIYSDDDILAVSNSTFYSNFATDNGGGIYAAQSGAWSPTLTNSTFYLNSATTGGGINVYSNLVGFDFANNIVAGSPSGGDCVVTGYTGIGINTGNLVQDGSCSAGLSGDPNLGPLTDNGGPTETMALLAASPAIDAGDDATCAAAPVNNLDQRGIARPQGAQCDIGAYEYIEPEVVSITRASPNPTNAASVDYTVLFSVPVVNVDTSDFSVATVGAGNIAGMAVSGVNGSGDTYTVTVSTGTGTGTIRLDVVGATDIADANGNPLANVPYQAGQEYTIVRADLFRSNGSQDGWILESSENSGVGGTLNYTDTALRVGDAALDRQYVAILSFDTSDLPDTAVITDVRLRIRMQGAVVGNVGALGGPNVDIGSGMFGASPTLEAGDFQAQANAAGVIGAFDAQAGNWYRAILDGASYQFVDLMGATQFRLYFTIDDNDDGGPDFVRIFSGNAAASNRPQLIIQYWVP